MFGLVTQLALSPVSSCINDEQNWQRSKNFHFTFQRHNLERNWLRCSWFFLEYISSVTSLKLVLVLFCFVVTDLLSEPTETKSAYTGLTMRCFKNCCVCLSHFYFRMKEWDLVMVEDLALKSLFAREIMQHLYHWQLSYQKKTLMVILEKLRDKKLRESGSKFMMMKCIQDQWAVLKYHQVDKWFDISVVL